MPVESLLVVWKLKPQNEIETEVALYICGRECYTKCFAVFASTDFLASIHYTHTFM